MAFNIRRMAAARDALAVASDNLKRYPWLTVKLNTQFIYLPEVAQDTISVVMRSKMNEQSAQDIQGIFDLYTCQQCGKVGRQCQCKQAEQVA